MSPTVELQRRLQHQERDIRQLQEQQQHSEQVLQLQQDLAISISGILFTSQSEMR